MDLSLKQIKLPLHPRNLPFLNLIKFFVCENKLDFRPGAPLYTIGAIPPLQVGLAKQVMTLFEIVPLSSLKLNRTRSLKFFVGATPTGPVNAIRLTRLMPK
jgi:hypothetical protein